MLTKSGNEIHVDVIMRVIDASRGIVQEIVRDITEQKRLEEQLQIRERMDSLGTLAGGIAHDFNNLLAGIMGNLDLLRFGNEDRLTREMQGNIDEAFRACERSAMLIKDIQSLSTGSVTAFTSVDVYTVAREVFTILERTTDKLIEKKIDFAEGRFFVFGKSDQIHQIFLNLGTNAVQAIEEKGVAPGDSITVSVAEYTAGTDDPMGLIPKDYIAISFSDTGTGMTDDVRGRAFDPLFSTKQRGANKGQGLGLAMVYNIITRGHNGHIRIDSTPGFGTTFVMYLPKADFIVHDETTGGSADLQGSETILIVEDEEAVREVARKMLIKYGYKTIMAVNSREGVDLFRMNREPIDLVLLDLTMPVMSGRMVLEALYDADPDVKVLIASGHSEEEIKNLSAARGFVKKPYKSSELIKTIRDILDS
jgi:signal transduction histidine kinase/CheY-like chemotaxis protein